MGEVLVNPKSKRRKVKEGRNIRVSVNLHSGLFL